MGTAIGVADAVSEFADREEAIGFDDASLAMDPGGLNGIEPGALAREVAGDDADALTLPLDLSVVVTDPVADLVADVPGGVVPDQEQSLLASRAELAAAPIEIVDGDRTDGPAIDEAQPDLVGGLFICWVRSQQEPVAGQRLRVRVIRGNHLFDQPQLVVCLDPGLQAGSGQSTPPDLVLEAQDPGRVGRGQTDQAVARTFFLGRQTRLE